MRIEIHQSQPTIQLHGGGGGGGGGVTHNQLTPLPDEDQEYAVETSQFTCLVTRIVRQTINVFYYN